MHPCAWVGNPQPPSLLLDFTTPVLDTRITFTRSGATATRVNSAGLIVACAANEPRFDYDPATGLCKGLLIEGARSNLLTYSSAFDNAAWSKVRVGVTGLSINAVTAPDGSETADKLVEDASTNTHYVQGSAASSIVTATPYTLSVYLKKAERKYATLLLNVGAVGGVAVDLDSGALTNVSGTATSTYHGNGWWRVSVTQTSVGTSAAVQVYTKDNSNNSTYAGDGASGIYAWGAQLEAGAFPTSYIPTTGSTATRNADAAQINDLSWFSTSTGTLYAEADTVTPAGGSAPIFVVQDAGGVNRHQLSVRSPLYGAVAASVSQASLGLSTAADAKVAAAYAAADFAASVAGGIASSASGSVPTGMTYATLGDFDFGGSESLNGHVRRLAYWPRRIANAQLQTLTA